MLHINVICVGKIKEAFLEMLWTSILRGFQDFVI